jgi:hypothetical protein
MFGKATECMSANDEKGHLTFRRLLLAKQLYEHGLDHSNNAGPLNNMIGVHNFHNAIEIVLRTILLHYEVRGEKQLNIEFETMLNDIDNCEIFRDAGIKLPYRQELRILNQVRNTVQHHGVEPAPSAMEDYRVFSRRFLEQACDVYFGVEFEILSPLDMVEDPELRELLRMSLSSLEEQKFAKSLALSKLAFEWASMAVWGFLPRKDFRTFQLLATGPSHQLRPYEKSLKTLANDVRKAEYYAALLSTGVSIVDYRRFESSTPWVMLYGQVLPAERWGLNKMGPDEETTRWVHGFVVRTIVHWGVSGLGPGVPDDSREEARRVIREALETDWD